MKIKKQDRCMKCKKRISNKRYYCYACFQALEQKGEEE